MQGIQDGMREIAPLFDGWEETMIWSCLQGHMGRAITDGHTPPRAAQIVLGDFCFFAGTPDAGLVRQAAAPILTPQTEDWCRVIEQELGSRVVRATRYSILKEPDIFDRARLTALIHALPTRYELRQIDSALYDAVMCQSWSRDLCALFAGCADYLARGLGFVVLENGIPVSGASSYSMYTGGIEIEIDTHPAYRRQGLATACGARLILACLERGLYPSWDAHDLRSVALAEKLGYHRGNAYPVFILDGGAPVSLNMSRPAQEFPTM